MNPRWLTRSRTTKERIVLKTYLDNIRLFSRNARLFLAGTFFFGFGVGTYWVLLNLYFRELGLSDGMIGRVISTQAFGTVLMAIPASILAVKFRLNGSWLLPLCSLPVPRHCW